MQHIEEWRLNSMLLQFRFKNFKSFADEAVLDMTATNIKEHSNSLIEKNGNKVLPLAAIYGANASGKSNLFLAFNSMRKDVIGLYDKEENHYLITPHIFSKELFEKPTEYEVSININDMEYRYGFSRNKNKVFEEWLFAKKFLKNTKSKEKNIFYRDVNNFNCDVRNAKENKEIKYVNSMIHNNELLITALGLREESLYSQIYKWFKMTVGFQNFSDDFDERIGIKNVNAILYKNDLLKERIVKLLKEFDNAIVDLKVIKEQDLDLNDTFKAFTCHKNSDGEIIDIPIENESSGTKKIYSLIIWIMISLDFGIVLWVDELDAKLHPLILRYIIKMYEDKESNKSGGQLIFSSHNLVCLDSSDLRRDEIWFVEKIDQISNLYSLYDFRDDENAVRSDLDFGKHYLSGRFGAIPFQEGESNGK